MAKGRAVSEGELLAPNSAAPVAAPAPIIPARLGPEREATGDVVLLPLVLLESSVVRLQGVAARHGVPLGTLIQRAVDRILEESDLGPRE